MADLVARKAELERIAAEVRSCRQCPLHRTRLQAVPGEGPVPAELFLIGEAPGRNEDASGRPFVGAAGEVLEQALRAAHIRRDAIFITNVVKCRPPGNRRPRRIEIDACRAYLTRQLELVSPRVVVTLGATALGSVLGPAADFRTSRSRVWAFEGIPLVPTYHPAAVLYNRRLRVALETDLRKAARWGREPRARPTAGSRGPSRGAKRSGRRLR